MLARDRRATLIMVLVTGLGSGLAAGLGLGLAAGFGFGLGFGLAFGLIGGEVGWFMSAFKTAWPSYLDSLQWLAFHHHLPWSPMSFLSDAHHRGVLRQAGAVYQFRHIELQHRLANQAAKIGSYFDVQDVSGDTYRVALVKVIDPAQGVDHFTTPDSGKRFVAAVFRVQAMKGSLQDEDANNDAAIVGSNGQTYSADLDAIARYTNLASGAIHLAQGKTVIGAVTFQLPDGVKVATVQWRADSDSGSAVKWNVRR